MGNVTRRVSVSSLNYCRCSMAGNLNGTDMFEARSTKHFRSAPSNTTGSTPINESYRETMVFQDRSKGKARAGPVRSRSTSTGTAGERRARVSRSKGKARAGPVRSRSTSTGTAGERRARVSEETVKTALCAALRQDLTTFSLHEGECLRHISRTG